MKTKILQTQFVTVLLLFGFLLIGNFTKAQETKTVYYYATAILKDKKLAVTPVVTSVIGRFNSAVACKADLESYLIDYIPAETSYKIDYSGSCRATSSGMGSSQADANKYRMQEIKRYKDWGYEIVHLNYISFSCDQ